MGRVLVDVGRLIILILYLPLIAIFVGPLLVLAVLRGHQWMGPITLDSRHYNLVGRVGILMLGLAIWLLVWSGLAWLTLLAISPPVTQDIASIATSEEVAVVPTSTPIPENSKSTSIPTPAPSPTATSTPTLGPIIPSALGTFTSTPLPTPSATTTPTSTATQLFNEVLATNTPRPGLSVTEITPLKAVTLTLEDRQAVITAVEEANLLLRNAIDLANEENLQNLSVIWQDGALIGITGFALDVYERYAKPFNVNFEYMEPPVINAQNPTNEVVVTSREKWSYGGLSTTNREAFEFIYILNQRNGRWIITRYSYSNLPLPGLTTIPLTVTRTATPRN